MNQYGVLASFALSIIMVSCGADRLIAPSSEPSGKVVAEETSTPESVWAKLKSEGKYSTVGTPLEAFLWAAAAGDSASVAAFVEAGIDKEGQALVIAGGNGRERTALHAAAAGGHLAVVKYLVGQGASISSLDSGRATPLHAAVAGQNAAVVTYLGGQGAGVDAQDAAGETPLHYAAAYGNVAIADYLLSRAANNYARLLTAKTTLGYTARNIAFEVGHTALAQNLRYREEVWFRNAASAGWLETVKDFIAAGVDIDAGDPSDATALHWAAVRNHLEVVKYLVEQGASVTAITNYGHKTAKDLAAGRGHTDIVEYLESVGG